jgi:hypothetical protein
MNIMKVKILVVLILTAFFSISLQAQDKKLSKEEKNAQKEIKRKEREEIEKMLKVYTICPSTDAEFVISAVERIAKNREQSLARDTTEGVKAVSRTDSYDVLITFKDKMRFADVRPDRSKPEEYENDKKVALENLQYYITTGKSMATEKPVEKSYAAFTTNSLQRSELIGNTLGISLIFDDANKMITTIYFVNAPKNSNGANFKNIEEWTGQRDKFLDSYTKCVAANLK